MASGTAAEADAEAAGVEADAAGGGAALAATLTVAPAAALAAGADEPDFADLSSHAAVATAIRRCTPRRTAPPHEPDLPRLFIEQAITTARVLSAAGRVTAT